VLLVSGQIRLLGGGVGVDKGDSEAGHDIEFEGAAAVATSASTSSLKAD